MDIQFASAVRIHTMNQTHSLQLRRVIALLSLFFVIPQSFSIEGEYYNADSLYLIYGAGILVSLCITAVRLKISQ
ncbi:MAG: hypothetical protein COW18_03315 [Zetaproteobacteria bacterium CG12_big_fil_rev_8_21_14_0_65_54_13]|nr:MAG: hypothetical protein COW18_03315 [Zetaproteobacteria bacterium CG12_big_fil_rev_8_21_14_0_65_54_13]